MIFILITKTVLKKYYSLASNIFTVTGERILIIRLKKGGIPLITKIAEKNITVYSLTHDFSVEVENDGEFTECYLSHKNHGVKTLMFGLLSKDIDANSLEKLIIANFPHYVGTFLEEYAD